MRDYRKELHRLKAYLIRHEGSFHLDAKLKVIDAQLKKGESEPPAYMLSWLNERAKYYLDTQDYC